MKHNVDLLVRGCGGDTGASCPHGSTAEFSTAETQKTPVLDSFRSFDVYKVVPTTSRSRNPSVVLDPSLHAPFRWSLLSQSKWTEPHVFRDANGTRVCEPVGEELWIARGIMGTNRIKIAGFLKAGIMVNIDAVVLGILIIDEMGTSVFDFDYPFPVQASY